jgi:hypothetical protein
MYTKHDLLAMKVGELKEVLRGMGQMVSGKKAELVERVLSNQNVEVTNNELPEQSNGARVTETEVTGTGNWAEVANVTEPGKGDRAEVTNEVTSEGASDWELKWLREENARLKAQLGKKSGGKPAIGVTKKVSLTLTEADWERVEREAKVFGSKSAYLRYVIENSLG